MNRRRVLALAWVLALVVLAVVVALSSKPLSIYEPQAIIKSEHLTAELYTKQTKASATTTPE